MPQKMIEKNGKEKLQISISVRCKNHPSGRIQLKRLYDNVKKGSTKAFKLERELIREAEQEKAERETKGALWEKLLNLYEVDTRAKVTSGDWCQSRQTFEEAINALRKWTEDWFRMPAMDIKPAHVTRLLHKMKSEGSSDSSIGKVRGDIKKVFDFAIIHELARGISQSPTTGVSIKSRRRMRTEILREDELKKLLAYAKDYEPIWYFIWSFAVYTGCRNGELYALKWSDIDFEKRMITVQRSYNRKSRQEKSTKTGEWRYVSICEPLWEVVLELNKKHEHETKSGQWKHIGYVLPRPGQWQNGDQAKKLRGFCEEIGITPVCFHTLRACFATELLRRGVDVPSVMRVGGWTSIKTMMRYVRLSGVNDKGITDPLDYRSDSPKETSRRLMAAVGEKYDHEDSEAMVIPLASRRYPGRR